MCRLPPSKASKGIFPEVKPDDLANWPAKSPQPSGNIAQSCAYHMIDVAAVAEVLLRNHPAAPLREALVLLVALHDLGKVSDSFQRMLAEGVPATVSPLGTDRGASLPER